MELLSYASSCYQRRRQDIPQRAATNQNNRQRREQPPSSFPFPRFFTSPAAGLVAISQVRGIQHHDTKGPTSAARRGRAPSAAARESFVSSSRGVTKGLWSRGCSGVRGGSRARVRRPAFRPTAARPDLAQRLNAAAPLRGRASETRRPLLGDGEGRPMIASTHPAAGAARREVALRKFGHAASSCQAAGSRHGSGEQPTPFCVLLQDLLLAQPDVVIFAASSNLCVQFCVSTTSRLLAGAATTRLVQRRADCRASPRPRPF